MYLYIDKVLDMILALALPRSKLYAYTDMHMSMASLL